MLRPINERIKHVFKAIHKDIFQDFPGVGVDNLLLNDNPARIDHYLFNDAGDVYLIND